MQEIIPKPVAMQNDTPSEFALRSFVNSELFIPTRILMVSLRCQPKSNCTGISRTVKKSLAPNTVFGTARRWWSQGSSPQWWHVDTVEGLSFCITFLKVTANVLILQMYCFYHWIGNDATQSDVSCASWVHDLF